MTRFRSKWASRRAVAGAARLLEGRSANVYRQYGLTPPAWAVLNQLAHGSPALIEELAGGRSHRRRRDLWERAERFLAAEVLTEAAEGADLLGLQRRALVPLELAALDTGLLQLSTPSELVALVSQALGGHES
jgi:hypothetical protein